MLRQALRPQPRVNFAPRPPTRHSSNSTAGHWPRAARRPRTSQETKLTNASFITNSSRFSANAGRRQGLGMLMNAIRAGIVTPGTEAALEAAEAGVTAATEALAAMERFEPTKALPRAREIFSDLVHRRVNRRHFRRPRGAQAVAWRRRPHRLRRRHTVRRNEKRRTGRRLSINVGCGGKI